MRHHRWTILTLALATLAVLALAPAAIACDQICERVPGTFCRQCVDTGQYTGATCQQSGPCGCFYTQNNCSAVQEEPEIELASLLMTPVEPQAAAFPQLDRVEPEAPPAD